MYYLIWQWVLDMDIISNTYNQKFQFEFLTFYYQVHIIPRHEMQWNESHHLEACKKLCLCMLFDGFFLFLSTVHHFHCRDFSTYEYAQKYE